MTLGDLISLVYRALLVQLDPDLAAVATAAIVNDWLSTQEAIQ